MLEKVLLILVVEIKLYMTFYQRDHQGLITNLTDSNQNKVQEYSYTDAYGTTQVTQTLNTNNPYAYTGRELDDTDLYYYRARYYDPSTQRFLSEDPIGFSSGDFNFYRYVGNSPGNFTDPFGLKYLSKPFITYNGTYTCRDCVAASYATCLVGGYGLGIKGYQLAARNPLFIQNFVQGATTQTPNLAIPAQRYGYGSKKLLDYLLQ